MKAYLVTYDGDGEFIDKPEKIEVNIVNIGMVDDDYGEIVEIPLTGLVIDQDSGTAIFIPFKKLVEEIEKFKKRKADENQNKNNGQRG